jgi:hypothetical protein
MMLANIKSEHGGSLILNSVSLMPVPRYPGGTGIRERGVGTRASASCNYTLPDIFQYLHPWS